MAATEPQDPNVSAQSGAAHYPGRLRQALFASAVGVALACTATVGSAAAHPASTTVSITKHPIVAGGVLSVLNQERAAHHLPALRMNNDLINSAYGHNVTMADQDRLSHQCPGEKSIGDRILAAHYNWKYAAENVGWSSSMTTAGAEGLETIMYNETAPNDGHRLNILSGNYRDIGISVITDTTHNKLWLTEDFGQVM